MHKRFYYGGQAVIEGVMMLGRRSMAVAVRRPNGEIAVHSEPLGGWHTGRLREIPFLRGIVVLVGTLSLGIRTLFYSAEVSLEEEQKVSSALLWGTVALGLILALGLFLALPLMVIHYLDPYISATTSNILEGLIRLVIFVAYLGAITLFPDIRRVFAYHGAEHKTINAYEAGEALEVDRVRSYGTAHYRCGTNFIFVVFVIAIVAFAFLGRPPMWIRYLERIALLPAIASISYEIIRLGAGHIKNGFVRAILTPGLALQALTTRQPDDRQIEVAISALRRVLAADTEPSKFAEETASVASMTNGAGGVHL